MARLLAAYVEAALAALDGMDEATLMSGLGRFPVPDNAGEQ
jgi:cytochrome b pre-mRNA-processing protein 3